MTRQQILAEIKPFFDVDELVCDHTYAKYGKASWNFLDTAYLHCLLVIRRDILKKPMWCNGKGKHQRGLRCNRCPMVRGKSSVYLSAHILGKAGDFDVTGMKAEAAREEIKKNAALLPYPIRIERGVSWLHFDVRPDDAKTGQKVIEFSA